jgi:signal transduction histidine kinase
MLVLHTSIQFLDDIAKKTFSSIVMPFLVLMVLSLIVLMLISNGILEPIREIIATSKQYAAGNFSARINVKTNNEFGELARYMEEMADELSRSNEYRKSFISNISHDFRSPLTSIKGYIGAMLDGTIPPENYDKYLNIVLNETNRLTKLTQGLLELNNFDSFDLQLDKSNFDIKSIITPTINTFEGRCQDKGIYLHAIFHTDNTIVYADRIRIQQVIYNLVDNAIKFTPEGRQITVQVTEKNDKVVVSVKDEGVGIPKDSLKKVFDRFYKTDPSRGKDKTGTGLGLAITKEIIKAHGETITVESEVGEGSEFIFSLPMQKEMQVPIKPVHLAKHDEEAEYISNGKFRVKKN